MKYLPLLFLPLLVLTACDSAEDEPEGELIIEDLVVGTGKTADPYGGPTVTYVGRLTDSTQFDAGTFSFALDNGEVLRGFNDGVRGMKVGGKRRITIPPSLGYGNQARRDPNTNEVIIPANSTLIFEVTLDAVTEVEIVELTPGIGEIADADDIATVTYKGTLTNGSTFDQGTFDFVVDGNRVIAGFNAGVRGMKEGGKRRITVPPVLGYGDQTRRDPVTGEVIIPANSTLIFEVMLDALEKD